MAKEVIIEKSQIFKVLLMIESESNNLIKEEKL
jgi:hypothetical protein